MNFFYTKKGYIIAFSLALFIPFLQIHSIQAQFSDAQSFTARSLVLPEMDQFQLGCRLFRQGDRNVAAWKAFQTFLLNYEDSRLAVDAQFLLAESIFDQAVKELQAGNPPDESGWVERKKKGFRLGKGIKKSIEELKNIGAAVSGEEPAVKETDRIDEATFSEAIEQYNKVTEKSKRTGLVDTALFRIGECYYNMADYANALKYFQKVQDRFPQSYIIGETLLAAAQCYLPGGDFDSAEAELNRLFTLFPSYKNDPRSQFIIGIIRFQKGQYQEALKSLEAVDSAEALYYAGQSLMKLGKPLLASAKFKKIKEQYRESRFAEVAAYWFAESYLESSKYTAAVLEYKQFLKDYPQSAFRDGALYKIGVAYFLNKDYSSARENFNLLINTIPSSEFALLARYLIAESYRITQQLKEASFSYGQIISQQPNVPIAGNARFKLGLVNYIRKDYSGAVETFQKFLEWHPFHPLQPYVYFLLANSYIHLGRADEAVNDYQQTFDRAPKTELSEAAMALLNRTRYSQGNYGQITSGYTYLLKALAPSESKWRSVSMMYLGEAYYRQGLYGEAINVFQSILSLYPHQTTAILARDGLSWCYFQLGDYDRAQKEREKIQEIKILEGVSISGMASGTYELANALFNQKKYTQALELYEKYLNEAPPEKDMPETIYRIGLCYYRMEYYTQAIEIWQSLQEKYPGHERTEEAAFQIADTYFRAHKYDEAVAYYRKILALYPKNPQTAEAALRIGQSYYNAEQDDKAIVEFESYLKSHPEESKVTPMLDLLEASLDRLEGAKGDPIRQRSITILKGLIEAGGSRGTLAAEAQFRVGRRYFAWKNYDRAAMEFEKAALTYPESPHNAESQFYAAESYYVQKKYDNAIETFQRFIQNFPNSEFIAATYFHLGTSYYNKEDFGNAVEAYKNLLMQAPDSEYASAGLFNMALCQKKLLRFGEAAESYMKLAANYPQDPNANFALLEVAKIKKEQNQPLEAIMILRDLESKIPAGDEQRMEIAYLIGEANLSAGDVPEAIRSLEAILTMPNSNSPWKLEALRKMGEIYEKQENWAEAARVYEQAGKMSGDPKISSSFRDRAKYLRATYLGEQSAPAPTPSSKKKKK